MVQLRPDYLLARPEITTYASPGPAPKCRHAKRHRRAGDRDLPRRSFRRAETDVDFDGGRRSALSAVLRSMTAAQVLVTRRRAAASAILDYARPRGAAADMRACPGESARTVGPAGQPAGPI